MFAAARRDVEVHDARLACWESGEGERPLVLVHGFTGSSLDWIDVVGELASERRVITFDHRGHGESTNAGDESAYSFDRLVDDLGRVLDAFDVAACDLLGHSMGGAVAMRYALQHPDRVRSLVLMDTAGRAIDGPSAELIQGAAGLVREHGMPVLLLFADAYSPPAGAPDSDLNRARNRRKLEQMDPAAFASLGDELARSRPVLDRLTALDVVTTVIVGENDELLRSAADELAATISGAVLSVIPDAAHSPQIENRSAWLDSVREHLRRVDSP